MQSGVGEKGTKVAIILINLPTKLKDVSFPSSTWWNKEPDELHTISQMKRYVKKRTIRKIEKTIIHRRLGHKGLQCPVGQKFFLWLWFLVKTIFYIKNGPHFFVNNYKKGKFMFCIQMKWSIQNRLVCSLVFPWEIFFSLFMS